MASNDYLNFSKNIRTTATGVNFVKQLYLNPTRFSPTQITQILRTLGLNVPRDAQVGAQLAQTIISGSAIIKGYDTLDTLSEVDRAKKVQSLNKLSVNTVALSATLFEEMGWIDQEQALVISVGVNVARIVGSAGADAQAWVGLALDFAGFEGIAKAKAQMRAGEIVRDTYKALISEQSQKLVASAQKMDKGEIGIFGFLSETVFGSSALFKQAIVNNPDLKVITDTFPGLHFIPDVPKTIYAAVSKKTWYGSTQSASSSFSYEVAGNYSTQDQAAENIFEHAFLPFIKPYVDIENQILANERVSLSNYAKLIAVDNLGFNLNSRVDLMNQFKRTLLTPYDLGENFIQDLQVSEYKSSGISGVFNFTSREPSLDIVKKADQLGGPVTILNNTKARDLLISKFNYAQVQIPPYYSDLANFIAALDVIDLIKSDNFYKKLSGRVREYIDQFFIFNDVNVWKKETQELVGLSQIRKVNRLAYEQVALILGTTSEKLVRINPMNEDEAGIFRIKR